MLVLLRLAQRSLLLGALALAVFFGAQAAALPAQAATCGFRCNILYSDAPAAASACDPVSSAGEQTCANDCRQQCQRYGWTATGESICSGRSGRPGFGVCTGCTCIATARTTTSCDAGGDGDESCTRDCGTICNISNTGAIQAPATGIECRTSLPAPRCVQTTLDICRDCVRDCLSGSAASGVVGVPADCHRNCRETTRGGVVPPCQDIPAAQAVSGLTSAPDGAVSGSGGSRSRIQSGVSASANEAASLPAGACAQRAIAADPANRSLIEATSSTYSAPGETWLCKRVCSTQQEASCVTGGCPGDASIRCCPPGDSFGIAPSLQCGGNGAAGADAGAGGTPAPGADGTPGSSDSGGAAAGSSGGASGGSGNSSVVGASNISADSGGLTRLILPSCIEDGGCQFSDLVQVGLNMVRFLFGLAGVLLLVVFVYAGIEYLIAGDASSVKSAEDRIKKALLGLFIMFFGYTLVNFLVGLFLGA